MRNFRIVELGLTSLCLVMALGSCWSQSTEGYERGEGFLFKNDSSGYGLQLRGYAQFSSEMRHFDGTEEWATRYRARRIRIRLVGNLPLPKIRYRLQVELARPGGEGDDAQSRLMDAWVAYRPSNRFALTFGQRASLSDNMELRMGSHTLQLPERSRVTSAFGTIREFGVFAEGRIRAGRKGWVKLGASCVTGDGSVPMARMNRGGLKTEGRLSWLPLGLFRSFGEFRQADLVREVQPKAVISAYGSVNRGMSSRRGREGGAILYLDNDFNEVLPDFWKMGVDFMMKYRGWTLLTEWVTTGAQVPEDITQRVRNNGSIATTFEGGVDAYVRGRMMLGSGFNAQLGYVLPSLWSLDARVTRLTPDEHSFLNNGTFYARNLYGEFGVTKYLGRDYGAKVQLGIMRTIAEPTAITVDREFYDGGEWTVRVLTQFAF
mgnify:CR=1 FL=1